MVSTNANLAKISSWKTRTYLFGKDNSIEKDGFGKKKCEKREKARASDSDGLMMTGLS